MPLPTDPLARLADIELPPPPVWQPWIVVVGSAAAVLVVVVALLLYLRHRKKQLPTPPLPHQALAQLEQLSLHWHNGQLSDREAAYRLATLLRLGLALPQLTRDCPTSLAPHAAQWETVISALERYRYHPQTAAPLPAALFEQTRNWLLAVTDKGA